MNMLIHHVLAIISVRSGFLTLKVGVDTDVEISLPISICGLYSLLVSLLCIETPEHVSIVKCVAVSLIAE
jgi:hypothetical protein